MIKNWKKILVIYIVVLVLANVAWLVFLKHGLDQGYTKTTATVTSLDHTVHSGSTRGTESTTYPTYTFTDASGRIHNYASTDGFNKYTKPIFGSNIGDKYTLYYGKDTDKDVIVAHGGDYWTILLAPFFLGLFIPAVIIFVVYIILWRFKSNNRVLPI